MDPKANVISRGGLSSAVDAIICDGSYFFFFKLRQTKVITQRAPHIIIESCEVITMRLFTLPKQTASPLAYGRVYASNG